MSKFSKKKLHSIYKYPLPVELICKDDTSFVAPHIVPHNPLSWGLFLYEYMRYCSQTAGVIVAGSIAVSSKYKTKEDDKIKVNLTDYGVLKVEIATDRPDVECDALKLWRNGFFGKGILSRSEPTWHERTKRRLHLVEHYSEKDLTSEEITILRRDERKKFKQLRETHEKQQLELEQQLSEVIEKQRSVKTKSEQQVNETNLKALKNKLEELQSVSLRDSNFQTFRVNNKVSLYGDGTQKLRQEDEWLIESRDKKQVLQQLEYLQLMPVEVFFLKFALKVVKVANESDKVLLNTINLFQKCSEIMNDTVMPNFWKNLQANDKFILHYVVYHHYRSQGWCVRSGIKFGVDYLLYDKGPPFSHAEYCLHIVENCNSGNEDELIRNEDFVQFSSLNRVIGGVRKTLIFVYVDTPPEDKFQEVIRDIGNKDSADVFEKLFELYKITEIVYRRWIPSRNRD